jgi:intracellular sulfur oxidation DsrE/DsrF family protein
MRPVTVLLCALSLTLLMAPIAARAAADDGIHVDVPVSLKDAKVVFNLDHLAFAGDEPIGLDFLRVMTERFRSERTSNRIVAIFHGPAGYMLLQDAAYNRVRNWEHGNPYKDQIAALLKEGVQFEECGETMKINHWTNEDLLPGAKVNTGANFRIIELVQQGYVQIQP